MAETRDLGRVAALVERGLGAVAVAAWRRPGWTCAAVGALTLASALMASRLQLNSDLTELLPRSFKSIQDLEKLTERFGGVGWVVVVGMDAEPDQLKRFADDFAPRLEQLELVRYVDHQRPSTFFEERALYFLDTADLESFRDQISARMAWEKRKRNPLYLDLEESVAPPLDFVDLKKKYEGVDGQSDHFWLAKQLGEPYYIDEGKRMIALLAKPASSAIDLAFSKAIVGEVEQLVSTVDLKQYGERFRVELTGRYKKRVDLQRLITRDLKVASLTSALLMVLYLALHFRRLAAVGLLMTPLFVGQTWVFGLASALFGSLNILTGFVGAILLGLGIDHGIHLLGRYEAELAASGDPREAVRRAFGRTGRGIVVAAVTTMVAFLGLSLSEFRPFHEFGAVCAIGVAVLVTTYTVVLPALLGIAQRLGWRPHRPEAGASQLHALVQRLSRPLSATALVVVLGMGLLIRQTTFNYDFAALESNDLFAYQVDKDVNGILGFSYVPVAVITDSLADERTVSTALRERKKAAGTGATIDFVASSADLLPLDQERKVPVIRGIGEAIAGVKPSWLEGEMRERFLLLRRMVKAEPFGRDDLPNQLKLLLKGVSGTAESGFVLVFPAFDPSEGHRIVTFANEVRGVLLPDGREVSAAGEELLLADILTMVTREAPEVLGVTLAAIVLTLVLLAGSLKRGLLCLIPPFFTLLTTLGLLPLVGLELNYLNIVMIPLLFGLAVDGGSHIVVRLAGGRGLDEVMPETGRAIVGSLTTSIFGFGTVLLAHHHGLNTFGAFAVLGLLVNLVASLVVMPAVLGLGPRRAVEAPAEA